MDSREKVLHLRDRARALRPEDEASAQALQMLIGILPLLTRLLPSDPAELDRYLRTIAWMSVQCRSDDAPVLRLYEWHGEQWEPIEVGEE